ncbi:MAG: hypothetical protein AAFN81_02945 [Bacteroidota bacterium]
MNSTKYELKPVDKKFLQAVDFIISKHKSQGLEPSNDNAISLALFGKRSVIAKIRTSSRGVTQHQIERFANYFDLDYNFFYRKEVFMPQSDHLKTGFVSSPSNPDQPRLILEGDNTGNIYNGQIYIYLDKVKEMASNGPNKMPKEYLAALDALQQECQLLEMKLGNTSQQLKAMEERFREVVLELSTQLNESRKQENIYLKKLLEHAQTAASAESSPVVLRNGQS